MTEKTPTSVVPARCVCRVLRIAIYLVMVVALLMAGAVVWALFPLGPDQRATGALVTSKQIATTPTPWGWLFEPTGAQPDTGVVIYPGGRVDARSYAPLAREIASRGHVVAVVEVPLSMAIFNTEAAMWPLEEQQSVKTWVVAGHSLGGVAAARFAVAHPDAVTGVLLLAAYPDEKADLSATGLAVTSLTGTADAVLDAAAWDAARTRLPADTVFAELPGANHSQFGSYGLQRGDLPATITPQQQDTLVADAAHQLLIRAAGTPPTETE